MFLSTPGSDIANHSLVSTAAFTLLLPRLNEFVAIQFAILIAIEDTSNFGQFLPELTIPTALPIGIDFGQAGAPMFEVRGAHTWLTWVDSETDLGYKEFLGSSWLATGFVPYSGLIDIQPARFRARNLILY